MKKKIEFLASASITLPISFSSSLLSPLSFLIFHLLLFFFYFANTLPTQDIKAMEFSRFITQGPISICLGNGNHTSHFDPQSSTACLASDIGANIRRGLLLFFLRQ